MTERSYQDRAVEAAWGVLKGLAPVYEQDAEQAVEAAEPAIREDERDRVREALLSDEAAETVARNIHYHQTQGLEDWADFGGERRAYALEHARLGLHALVDSQLDEGSTR
jgi:hypothetical protein